MKSILPALGALRLTGHGWAGDATLWYSQPAGKWTDALPLGNGRLGAMVFGGTGTECIQLNEESLWAECQIEAIAPDFKKHHDEVRRLMLAGYSIPTCCACNWQWRCWPLKLGDIGNRRPMWIRRSSLLHAVFHLGVRTFTNPCPPRSHALICEWVSSLLTHWPGSK